MSTHQTLEAAHSFEAAPPHTAELATAPIGRLFVRYAVPGIAGLLLISLQAVVDGALLGRFVGANAMASVNVAMPCFSLLMALGLAVGVGCGCVIAIRTGEGRHQDAADALTTSCWLAVGLSTLLGLILLLWGPSIVRLLGANDVLQQDSAAYIQTLAWFFPCVALLMVGDYTLKALGRPVRVMLLLSGLVVLNVVLDIVAIVGLGWGVRGAALATGISCGLTVLAMFAPLLRQGKAGLGMTVAGGHFRPRLAGRILYNGSSEGMAEIANGLTTVLFNLVMVSLAGASGVAAFTALNYLLFTATAVFLGMVDGIAPVIGYNYGCGRPDRMRSMLRLGCVCVLGSGFALAALMFFGGESLIGLVFDSKNLANAPAAAEAAAGARLFAFAVPACGLNILISGYFTAIGNARVSALVSLLRSLVFIVAGLAILPDYFGMSGVWLTVPLAECATLLLAVPLLRHGLRMLMERQLAG